MNGMNVETLLKLAERHIVANQVAATAVPFLAVSHKSQPTSITRAVLNPSFCVVLKGTKRIHLGQDVLTYKGGDFLASIVAIPAAGHVAEASKAKPFVGLRVDLSQKEIAAVISEAKIKVKPRSELSAAAFVGKTDAALYEIFAKLLEEPGPYLANLLKKEMLYRLLTGDYGHLFYQKVLFDSDGIGKIIAWIRDNYTTPFTVDELAREYGMSVSALHHKFKLITTMSPLQYQKQLRLQEARRLLLTGKLDATTAALEVGYESASQFNREYRRQFGLPPLKDIKAFAPGSID